MKSHLLKSLYTYMLFSFIVGCIRPPTIDTALHQGVPLSFDTPSIHLPMCDGYIFAIPSNVSIPTFPQGKDPLGRWKKTIEFLRETGIQVSFDKVNKDSYVPPSGYDPLQKIHYCDTNVGITSLLWNNSSTKIVIKEISIIVEAYDYEPSKLPPDYKIVALFPPELGGPGVSQVTQFDFYGEAKPTSNALRLLSTAKNPSPITFEPDNVLQITTYLQLASTGTYRLHYSIDWIDSKGNTGTTDSSSVITRWSEINELNLAAVEPIDVK